MPRQRFAFKPPQGTVYVHETLNNTGPALQERVSGSVRANEVRVESGEQRPGHGLPGWRAGSRVSCQFCLLPPPHSWDS